MSDVVRPPTREATLHRIIPVDPPRRSWRPQDAVEKEAMKRYQRKDHDITIDGQTGLLILGRTRELDVIWGTDLSMTTGVDLSGYKERSIGALLIFPVDDDWYAMGYGTGHHWLADRYRDPRFGLGVAVRCLDPQDVMGLIRRRPGARGRTDTTIIPAGIQIRQLVSATSPDIARRLNGRVKINGLSHCDGRDASIKLEGAAGLRLRLAIPPSLLAQDVRRIKKVRADEVPGPFSWVDHITPVTDERLLNALAADLGSLIEKGESSAERIALAVPEDLLTLYQGNVEYRVGRMRDSVDILTLDHVLRQAADSGKDGSSWLNSATVRIYPAGEKEQIRSTPVTKWLEVSIARDSSRFLLLDGHWYEIDLDYSARLAADVRNILAEPSSLVLPPWESGDEKDYNEMVGKMDGYTCLDRRTVRTEFFKTHGFEACDLLGPELELIHVKQADGSAPLSHLFSQGLLAGQTLAGDREARELFRQCVNAVDPTRKIPDDFRPSRIVFGIMLKSGKVVSQETIFPFSQATLVGAKKVLTEQLNIAVEVAPIVNAKGDAE